MISQERKRLVNENVKAYLSKHIGSVQPIAVRFFSEQRARAQIVSPVAEEMVDMCQRFVGGKNLRGALTVFGFELFGGTAASEDLYKASFAVEIIHACLLMHDDIMDEDTLRRGHPTIHVQYETIQSRRYASSTRNRRLFGTSMAINLGDLGPHYAALLLDGAAFSSDQKCAFHKRLSEVVIQTIYGQALDATYEQELNPTEEKVLEIHTYKTGYYTILGPLQYGALLAGVTEMNPRYRALERFGLPVGIAFQLRDDELGMFSTSEKLGKPISSDLRQGKNTIMFAHAFSHGSQKQIELLTQAYGNPNVSEADVERIREILIETGAVKRSQELSLTLVEQGKAAIPEITTDPELQAFLGMIAEYVITRDS